MLLSYVLQGSDRLHHYPIYYTEKILYGPIWQAYRDNYPILELLLIDFAQGINCAEVPGVACEFVAAVLAKNLP